MSLLEQWTYYYARQVSGHVCYYRVRKYLAILILLLLSTLSPKNSTNRIILSPMLTFLKNRTDLILYYINCIVIEFAFDPLGSVRIFNQLIRVIKIKSFTFPSCVFRTSLLECLVIQALSIMIMKNIRSKIQVKVTNLTKFCSKSICS